MLVKFQSFNWISNKVSFIENLYVGSRQTIFGCKITYFRSWLVQTLSGGILECKFLFGNLGVDNIKH